MSDPDRIIASNYYYFFSERINFFLTIRNFILEEIEEKVSAFEIINKKLYLNKLMEINPESEEIEKLKNEISEKQPVKVEEESENVGIELSLDEITLLQKLLKPFDKNAIIEYLNNNVIINLFTELDIYLFNISKHVLIKYPNNFGKSTVEIKDLLEMNFNKDLILEKKIELKLHDELFDLRKGLNYISKTLKIPFIINDKLMDELIKFKIYRDVLVHSSGIINYTASRKGGDKLKVGDKMVISDSLIKKAVSTLFDVVKTIDKTFINLFPEREIEN